MSSEHCDKLIIKFAGQSSFSSSTFSTTLLSPSQRYSGLGFPLHEIDLGDFDIEHQIKEMTGLLEPILNERHKF